MIDRSYDDYKLEGNKHECICGSIWTDADGKPCHAFCKNCLQMIEYEEYEINNGYCERCKS